MIIGQRCQKGIFALLYYIGIFMLTVGVIMKFNKDGKLKLCRLPIFRKYIMSQMTL